MIALILAFVAFIGTAALGGVGLMTLNGYTFPQAAAIVLLCRNPTNYYR
ncbi:hypothetical protein KDA23_04000 [Candidatus Saccharibacteria bacterium]|nr:hypothetical protein [Candidatus Saccharibacteria bacterium]